MSFQFLIYLRIFSTALLLLLLLPFLILIEIYHSIFTGRFRKFDGKTVLITGAGNGLGREMAIQLSKKNCTVLCVDMKKADVLETISIIKKQLQGSAKAYVCDITDCQAVNNLRDTVLTEYGKIDLLINNAAFLYLTPINQGSDEHFRRCIDVNILGTSWITRAFLPTMKREKSGQILFICSMASIFTEAGLAAYSMTKAAILTLAWCIKDELSNNPEWKKIKISSALPIFINTNPKYANFYKSNIPAMSVEYTASCALEGARRGFTEFSIPGQQFGSRLSFLVTRVFPRSFVQLLKPTFGVEIGQSSDETLFTKLTSPDYSLSGELFKKEQFTVNFSSS